MSPNLGGFPLALSAGTPLCPYGISYCRVCDFYT